MTDENSITDRELGTILAKRTVPAEASDDFTARLLAIPAAYPQPSRRGASDIAQAWSFKELFAAMSPAVFLSQASAMAAALVLGVWMGMETDAVSPPDTVEVDVAMLLSGDDMGLYSDQEEDL